MAKDGTMRGGARAGAGTKQKKTLVDKIAEGKTATILQMPCDLTGNDMPPVKDYLKKEQRGGEKFLAEEIYKEVWEWLKDRGCETLINPLQIEQYAMSVARWISIENFISETGYLAKHPTTGAAIGSPYVSMSRDYMKQINSIWYQIKDIVDSNCAVSYNSSPYDNTMERLLQARKG